MPRCKLHQIDFGGLFRDPFIDVLVNSVRSGEKSFQDAYPFLFPLQKGDDVIVGIRTRCGKSLDVDRIAYNYNEMTCERCGWLTMGVGDEFHRPDGSELPVKMVGGR